MEENQLRRCADCGTEFDSTLLTCPNCGCPANLKVENATCDCDDRCPMGGAFKTLLRVIVYVLFVPPVKLWKAAMKRLSGYDKKYFTLDTIQTEWPTVTLVKRLFLDYLFDALIFVSWLSVAAMVCDLLHVGGYSLCCTIGTWVLGVYAVYWLPAIITAAKDVVTLLLRYPLRRLIKLHRRRAAAIDKKYEE